MQFPKCRCGSSARAGEKGAITLTRGVSRGIAINDLENVADADSLLHALVNGEDGAKDRAIAYLKNKGIRI